MSIPAFTPAWADAFLAAVNESAEYRDIGRNWSNPVALVVEPVADGAIGSAVQVDLQAGRCVAAAAVAPGAVSAPFVLAAPIAIWREILHGVTDPISAVAKGSVRLTRGSLGTLMIHARTAKALLACARTVDTLWPDTAA